MALVEEETSRSPDAVDKPESSAYHGGDDRGWVNTYPREILRVIPPLLPSLPLFLYSYQNARFHKSSIEMKCLGETG